MKNNQLQLIVKKSGLETTKADYILSKFQGYFAIAAEWESKAKTIKVINADQTAEMQMARTARLFLVKERSKIENTRKELKEQLLREGRAIDGISNVLKALIIPIEEYFEKQEKFVELQEREKLEVERLEREKSLEKERKTKEDERIRLENERLKKEAIIREKKLKEEKEKREKERIEQAKILKKSKEEAEKNRLKQEAELKKQKEINEKDRLKAEKERKEKEKIEAELRAKKEAEEKARREEEERIENEKRASDKEKLAILLKTIQDINLPEVKSKSSKNIISQVNDLLKEIIELLEK